jgi:hypothetical protein
MVTPDVGRRQTLVGDLWAWGLSHLAAARSAWDAARVLFPDLRGRELELWRPALTAAVVLERDGVLEPLESLHVVFKNYRSEKDDLADEIDPNRLIVMAIADQLAEQHQQQQPPDVSRGRAICDMTTVGISNCTLTMELAAPNIADRANRLRSEHYADSGLGDLSARQVGRRLVKPLRVGKLRRDAKKRTHVVEAKTLGRLFITHAVWHPHGPQQQPDPNDTQSSGTSSCSNGTPQPTHVTHVTNVTTSSAPPPGADVSDIPDITDMWNGKGSKTDATGATTYVRAAHPIEVYPLPAYAWVQSDQDLV